MLHLSTSPLACAGGPLCAEGVQIAASSPTPIRGTPPASRTPAPTLSPPARAQAPVTSPARRSSPCVSASVGAGDVGPAPRRSSAPLTSSTSRILTPRPAPRVGTPAGLSRPHDSPARRRLAPPSRANAAYTMLTALHNAHRLLLGHAEQETLHRRRRRDLESARRRFVPRARVRARRDLDAISARSRRDLGAISTRSRRDLGGQV